MTRLRPFLLVLLLGTPALALEPAACETYEPLPGGGAVQSFRPVDMGGGMVAQGRAGLSSTTDNIFVHEFTVFELCATGRAIDVTGAHEPHSGQPLTDVAAIVQDAIASPEPVTLEEIAGRIGGRLIEASTAESCGCAVFYPGLRGN